MPMCIECSKASVKVRLGLCNACYSRHLRNDAPERYKAKQKEYQERYKAKNADRVKANSQKYRDTHRQQLRDTANLKTRMLKLEVIANYGCACTCCGESNPAFLTIDHINGGGMKDRASDHGGWRFYTRLKKLGFPKDKYQILCYNCNLAKGFFGACPHEDQRQQARVKGSLETVPSPLI